MDDNTAPCDYCGDLVEEDDAFRIIAGRHIVHERCRDDFNALGSPIVGWRDSTREAIAQKALA